MKLKTDGFWCNVLEATPQERSRLNTLLSFRIDAYTKVYYRRMLQSRYGLRFPAGFVPRIAKQMQFEIEGWKFGKQTCCDSTLRDYQIEGVNRILKLSRGNLIWATGAGKTFAVGAILNELKFKQALFVTVSRPLVAQTCDKLRQFGQEASTEIGKAKVTVVTHQLLERRFSKLKKWLQDIDVLIFDECHHTAARTIYKIAQNCPAAFRCGLTATPWRDDHKEFLIEGATGPNIHTILPKYLISRGYLANPIVLMVKVPRFHTNAFEYRDIYNDVIVTNCEQHKRIIQVVKLLEKRRPTQVLVDRVEHAHLLGKFIPEATVVTGKNRDKNKIVNDFVNGRVPIMISTPLLKEGFDAPIMRSLIMAGSFKSLVGATQAAGRLLRPKPNKERPILVDFMYGNKYLKKHAIARQRVYEQAIAPTQIVDLELLSKYL
jgi:superfamily II DNA or RNA helicase